MCVCVRWWKVDILLNALSAMNAPVDLVCVRCPHDVTHSEKVLGEYMFAILSWTRDFPHKEFNLEKLNANFSKFSGNSLTVTTECSWLCAGRLLMSTAGAGFSPSKNTVWMCGNHFWNPFQFRRILAHELVHAFDFARAKIDTANIDHIACTEIRAANLSGECEVGS